MLTTLYYNETTELGGFRCCLLEGSKDETDGKAEEMILSGDWIVMTKFETAGKSTIKMYGGKVDD